MHLDLYVRYSHILRTAGTHGVQKRCPQRVALLSLGASKQSGQLNDTLDAGGSCGAEAGSGAGEYCSPSTRVWLG